MSSLLSVLQAALERQGRRIAPAAPPKPSAPPPEPARALPVAGVVLGGQQVQIYARYLAGRCANGAERDSGRLWHAKPENSREALCGAEAGRRSAGWGPLDGADANGQAVTCPCCLKRFDRLKAVDGGETDAEADSGD